MIHRLASLTLATTLFASAQDPAPATPVKPSVEKIGETTFRIGKVTFDQKSRQIRFPTKVNMTEGLLEYLVVTQGGKVHESLLITEASPTDINLAITLLRYPPSRELIPLPAPSGGASDNYPKVPAEVKAAARFLIEVEWLDNGQVRRLPVSDWIQHAVKTTAMHGSPWIYNGSDIHEGKFVAEMTGDVLAIYLDPAAIINYAGTDNNNDDVWIPFPKRVPTAGTEITLIMSPFSSNK
ncbi:MAG: hypothetical protein H8M99_02500 [Gloeobacteraceae cyanobacterium ES-bin-144]|nr:hypothetical protein [Verrucomicrobiales bacterium]